MADVLNWLGNLDFNKESPVKLNITDLKESANKLRELNRQRAIQKATSDALKPDGTIDYDAARKSLISQGFGENADQLVNAMSGTRTEAAKMESESRNRDYMDMIKGLLSPAEFVKRHQGQDIVTTKPSEAPTSSYNLLTDKDIPGNVETPKISPNQISSQINPNEISIQGQEFKSKASEGKLQDTIPQNVYTTTKSGPQITPDYLKSDIDVNKLSEGFGVKYGTKGYEFEPFTSKSMNENEKNNLAATLRRSGIEIKTNEDLDNAVKQAENQVLKSIPLPVFNPYVTGDKFAEELGRYQKEMQEYPAKQQAALLEFRKGLKSGFGEVQGTELSKNADIRAKEQLEIEKKKQIFDLAQLSPETNPNIYKEIRPDQLQKINDMRKAVVNFKRAGNSFEDAVDAAINKSKIDGSVNWDAVVGNLTSMGAFPSAEAVKLKLALDPNQPVTKEIITATVKGNIPGFKYKTKGASDKWIANNIDELNQSLYDLGGNKIEYKTTKSGAEKQVDDMKNKPKSFTEEVKKSETKPKSDVLPKKSPLSGMKF
jgi:hypothetical protein